MWIVMGLVVALLVATFNGANDNFKGFATIWGADILSFKQSLFLSTLATVLGGLLSIYLAGNLLSVFSGKEIITVDRFVQVNLLLSVSLGALITLILATLMGFPISTTHALLGGLVGAGLGIPQAELHWHKISTLFILPLLFSPFVSALTVFLFNKSTSKNKSTAACVCLVNELEHIAMGDAAALTSSNIKSIKPRILYSNTGCANELVKFSNKQLVDYLHPTSAFLISFSRGVNDTPKLASLLLIIPFLTNRLSIMLVVLMMAIGGYLYSKKVATTMSKKITPINHVNGIKANLTTAFLVLIASHFGLPVSTTHVAVGSITGIALTENNSINKQIIYQILMSWILTLPVSMTIAYLAVHILNSWTV